MTRQALAADHRCACPVTRPRVVGRLEAAGRQKWRFEVFFANEEYNGNYWRLVFGPGLEASMRSAIGGHGVVFQDCSPFGCKKVHPPPTPGLSCRADIGTQRMHSVARVVDYRIDEEKRTVHLVMETSERALVDAIERGDIRYVSPGICPDHFYRSHMGPLTWLTVYTFAFQHIAFVDDPAYGPVASVSPPGSLSVGADTVRLVGALRRSWPSTDATIRLIADWRDQPRVPAGSPHGGRWGSGGGATKAPEAPEGGRDYGPEAVARRQRERAGVREPAPERRQVTRRGTTVGEEGFWPNQRTMFRAVQQQLPYRGLLGIAEKKARLTRDYHTLRSIQAHPHYRYNDLVAYIEDRNHPGLRPHSAPTRGTPNVPRDVPPGRLRELDGQVKKVAVAFRTGAGASYQEMSSEVRAEIARGSRGGSYVPRLRRSFDLFASRATAARFHRRAAGLDPSLPRDGPIYVLGTTNHVGDTGGRRLHSAYRRAQGMATVVMMGWWVDAGGRPYTDVSIASGDRSRAERLARGFVQDAILEVHPDGRVEEIDTRTKRSRSLAGVATAAILRLIGGYDPNQPRDDIGRWTRTGYHAGGKLDTGRISQDLRPHARSRAELEDAVSFVERAVGRMRGEWKARGGKDAQGRLVDFDGLVDRYVSLMSQKEPDENVSADQLTRWTMGDLNDALDDEAQGDDEGGYATKKYIDPATQGKDIKITTRKWWRENQQKVARYKWGEEAYGGVIDAMRDFWDRVPVKPRILKYRDHVTQAQHDRGVAGEWDPNTNTISVNAYQISMGVARALEGADVPLEKKLELAYNASYRQATSLLYHEWAHHEYERYPDRLKGKAHRVTQGLPGITPYHSTYIDKRDAAERSLRRAMGKDGEGAARARLAYAHDKVMTEALSAVAEVVADGGIESYIERRTLIPENAERARAAYGQWRDAFRDVFGPYRTFEWAEDKPRVASQGDPPSAASATLRLIAGRRYDPSQPRDPDGKWTDTGAGGGSKSAETSEGINGAGAHRDTMTKTGDISDLISQYRERVQKPVGLPDAEGRAAADRLYEAVEARGEEWRKAEIATIKRQVRNARARMRKAAGARSAIYERVTLENAEEAVGRAKGREWRRAAEDAVEDARAALRKKSPKYAEAEAEVARLQDARSALEWEYYGWDSRRRAHK